MLGVWPVVSQCSMCGQHTTQQMLATLDGGLIDRAHTASFAAVLNRLVLLRRLTVPFRIRSQLLKEFQLPPLPLSPSWHSNIIINPPPLPSNTLLPPSPNSVCSLHPIQPPCTLPLHPSLPTSLSATLLLSDQQGSVTTTLSSHPPCRHPSTPTCFWPRVCGGLNS